MSGWILFMLFSNWATVKANSSTRMDLQLSLIIRLIIFVFVAVVGAM
jgi:hypothetical protein